MAIRDIPPTYDAFKQWSEDYERKTFTFAETNQRIGSATRDLFASWFPRIFTPFVRYGIYALLDDAMIASFGFPKPLPGTRALLGGGLRLRGYAVRLMPPRRKPNFVTDRKNRTHPHGYRIEELGPPRLVAAEKGKQTSGGE